VERPYPGKAIGLQLEPDRQGVGLAFRHLASRLIDLAGYAQQVLHVVPHLVRDHTGLGEIARRVETRLHLFVESEVDVDLLVTGAVKRPHGGSYAGHLKAPDPTQHGKTAAILAAVVLRRTPPYRGAVACRLDIKLGGHPRERSIRRL